MKLFIKTYGCQMNVYDSDKIVELMHLVHGFERTDDLQQADLIVFNTCSVREKASEKLFSDLGRLRPLKKQKPLIVAVGGCVASQEGEAIIRRSPEVDIVFGPQTLHRLPALYSERMRLQKPVFDVSFPAIEKFDQLPVSTAPGVRADVTIMEGCSKFCSFCIVPYTRGMEISRPFDDVLHEVALLHERGVKEIQFLGQNVNDYRGRMHQGSYATLATLIDYAAALEGLKRLRFTTSHPKAFGDDLIDIYRDCPKLVNQLHLPVQSGSNRILEAMKRGYSVEIFEEKIAKLRTVREDISITTDIIVGFPGESDEDFEQTMALVKRIGFDGGFSFIYSPRPGTPASMLPDDLPLEVKKERLAVLQALLQAQHQARSERLLGQTLPVLIDALDRKTQSHWVGRTECHRLVHVEGSAHLGEICQIHITQVTPHALRGSMLGISTC